MTDCQEQSCWGALRRKPSSALGWSRRMDHSCGQNNLVAGIRPSSVSGRDRGGGTVRALLFYFITSETGEGAGPRFIFPVPQDALLIQGWLE